MIIVSGYYEIPSKRRKEFYYEHIQRFFRKLRWHKIIFFTDQENFINLKHYAGPNVRFYIQEFNDLPIFKDFSQELWKEQILLEHEKYHKDHSWQLGAIWSSKSYFVQKACEFTTDDWLIWVDAGCVRTEAWELSKFTKRNLVLEPGVYLQLLNTLPSKEFFEYPDVFIAGSHILFHRSYIDLFIESYRTTVNTYIQDKKSIISDQYIMASMCSKYPFLRTIQSTGNFPDKWFFLFYVI